MQNHVFIQPGTVKLWRNCRFYVNLWMLKLKIKCCYVSPHHKGPEMRSNHMQHEKTIICVHLCHHLAMHLTIHIPMAVQWHLAVSTKRNKWGTHCHCTISEPLFGSKNTDKSSQKSIMCHNGDGSYVSADLNMFLCTVIVWSVRNPYAI